jgi:hypothetical protein
MLIRQVSHGPTPDGRERGEIGDAGRDEADSPLDDIATGQDLHQVGCDRHEEEGQGGGSGKLPWGHHRPPVVSLPTIVMASDRDEIASRRAGCSGS